MTPAQQPDSESIRCPAGHPVESRARRGDVCGATIYPTTFEPLDPDEYLRRFLINEHWWVPPRCMEILDYEPSAAVLPKAVA